jgi:hypothetical protein
MKPDSIAIIKTVNGSLSGDEDQKVQRTWRDAR